MLGARRPEAIEIKLAAHGGYARALLAVSSALTGL